MSQKQKLQKKHLKIKMDEEDEKRVKTAYFKSNYAIVQSNDISFFAGLLFMLIVGFIIVFTAY